MAQVEKKRKERFGTVPTKLPGVQLRVEPGAELDILLKTTEKLYQLAKQFAEADSQVKDLTTQQTPRREEIIAVAKEHEGLRGLTSEKENFVLTVTPKEAITWDRKLLQKSLDIAYSAVVIEDLVIRILIPVGFVTGKKKTISEGVMTKAIEGALLYLGISEEESAKIIQHQVNLTVDEKKLAEVVKPGGVTLLEGAKTTEITWQVRVDRLKK